MTIKGISIPTRGRTRGPQSFAACTPRLSLKIMYQVFHANTTGQEPRPLRFHHRKSAFTSVIDAHDPIEIDDKVTLGMSVTGFHPVGANAPNPRVREPPLENEPLLGISVDPRNLQHHPPSAGRRLSSPFE